MNSLAVSNSLIGAKLPYEIIEHIWSFNYFWAATTIQINFKKFIRNKVRNICSLMKFAHFNCNLGLSMNNYSLHYNNKIINKSSVFNTLNACKCCSRHQINKPTKIALWNETEFHNTQDTACSCPCRHLSRFLCRVVDES